MLYSFKNIPSILGLAFATTLLVGCQDMLGNGKTEPAIQSSTEQDLQFNAQQAATSEGDAVTTVKSDKAQESDAKHEETSSTCVPASEAPKTEEPKPTEEPHHTEEAKPVEEPKHTDESKPVEVPIHVEEPKPADEPIHIEAPKTSTDLVMVCKELWEKLNSEAVLANTSAYMEVKAQWISKECDHVLSDAAPVTPPPPEPTHEEVCQSLKKSLDTMSPDAEKYSYLKTHYENDCLVIH